MWVSHNHISQQNHHKNRSAQESSGGVWNYLEAGFGSRCSSFCHSTLVIVRILFPFFTLYHILKLLFWTCHYYESRIFKCCWILKVNPYFNSSTMNGYTLIVVVWFIRICWKCKPGLTNEPKLFGHCRIYLKICKLVVSIESWLKVEPKYWLEW